MARQVLLIKYQLQQQMATKDGKRAETVALRVTRRSKNHEPKEINHLESENPVNSVESKDVRNQIENHKEQQNNPKNEKQSNSPTNNELQPINIVDDISRRVTRSSILIPKKIYSEVEMQKEPMTPEENQISKVSEQSTTKKLAKVQSAQSLQSNGSGDLIATVKKPIGKILETLVSPYKQGRKSYRRIHKNEIVSIPYRKCHDAFEGRIVSIINKIEAGKNCLRDFQSLIEKIQRISGKDMMNKYIIAGIATIIKLSKEKDIYDVTKFPIQKKVIERLQLEQRRVREKIIEEMDRVQAFDQSLVLKNQEFIDSNQYKNLLIRKIYKIMKHTKSKKHSHCANQMRKKAIQDCQRFLGCQTNVGSLIKFVKLKTDFQQ